MTGDLTIGAIEQDLAGIPHAIAGLEGKVASIFQSAVGVGEEALNVLGLKHALGVVQNVATGTTGVLNNIATVTENVTPEAQAVATIAETVTPAALAAQLIPHSGAVLTELDKASVLVDSVAAGTIDPATIAVVKHNQTLIHLIHEGLQGVETAGDIAGKLPIIQNIGMWGLNISTLNGFLHWLEPIFSKFDQPKA